MRIPKRIYLIYILFIGTVALLSVGGQVLIQREINNHIDDSQVINLAGRQRFRSQQIVKAIVILTNSNPDAKHRKAYLNELKTAVANWEKYHQQLQNGQMPGLDSELHNSNQIKRMFQTLNPHYEVIHKRALQMIRQLENPDGAVGKNAQAILQEIFEHEPLFLSEMDAIVFQYDREAKEKVSNLRKTEFFLVCLTLLALFLEWQFVFRPAIKQLRRSIQLQQDTTDELQQANKELKAQKHFIEKVTTTLPSRIIIIDIQTLRLIYSNHSSEKSVGYTNAEMQEHGLSLLKPLFHPEDYDNYSQFFRDFVSGSEGEIRETEFRSMQMDGYYHHFLFRGTVFHRNETGTPNQVIGILQDITPMKLTETELQKTVSLLKQNQEEVLTINEELTVSNEEFHYVNEVLGEKNHLIEKVFSTIPSLIYIYDLSQSKTIFFSRDTTAMAGYNLNEFQTKREETLKKMYTDTANEKRQQFYRDFAHAKDNEVKEMEFQVMAADGSEQYYLIRGTVFRRNEQGIPDQIVAVSQDITLKKQTELTLQNTLYNLQATNEELTQTEEQLQELNNELENRVERRTSELAESNERYELVAQVTKDAIWEWLYGQEFIQWSYAFQDLFGYLSEEEERFPTLKAWQERIHADDRDQVVQWREESIQTQQNSWQASYRFRRIDGTYAYVLDQALILCDHNNQPYRLVGSLRDISPLKEAEMSLQKQNQELQRINRDMDNFIYVSSHDLKHPIVNLEGLLEVLQIHLDRSPDEESSKWVNLMDVSVNRLKKTILEIADISKIQKGLEEPHEVLDFQSVWQEVLADTTSLITWADATIRTDFDQKTIFYSKNNLKTILDNLLSNALKYRASERPTEIQVTTLVQQGQLQLMVSDNGLGLNQPQQSKLFTMYKRLHSHVEGTGIGLYMIKRIIENNGGKITVKSEPGVGSTFTVIFNHNAMPG